MPPEDWKERFLSSLTETGNVSKSCRLAGISRQSAYRTRDEDPVFASLWDEAIEEGVDALEEVARGRAKVDSDTLLIFLLKAHRPQKYRENVRHEHEGDIKVIVQYADDLPNTLSAPPGTGEDSP